MHQFNVPVHLIGFSQMTPLPQSLYRIFPSSEKVPCASSQAMPKPNPKQPLICCHRRLSVYFLASHKRWNYTLCILACHFLFVQLKRFWDIVLESILHNCWMEVIFWKYFKKKSLHLSMDIWAVSSLVILWVRLLWTFVYESLCEQVFISLE